MGLAYGSPRQTGDVDLTADFVANVSTAEEIGTALDAALDQARVQLGYDRLRARVQSIKELPRQHYPNAEFPALKLKIGYAQDAGQIKRLNEGKASNVVEIDISFNEPMQHVQVLDLDGGQSLYAYGYIDLVAEKYRAMLQQPVRKRARRQDAYDLHYLITSGALNELDKDALHRTLVKKCRPHGIEPMRDSIDDPEVRKRSARDWDTLALEIGSAELPPFDLCYEMAAALYRGLPWSGRE
jgi:hypothetical protein